MQGTPAAHRYNRRTWGAALAYISLVVANLLASRAFSPPPVVLAIMAVVSALPIIAMIALLGQYLRDESDEYVRNRLIFSILLALGAALCFVSVFGILQLGGLMGDIPVFVTFVVWCCAWGLAKTWLDWRDRREAARS